MAEHSVTPPGKGMNHPRRLTSARDRALLWYAFDGRCAGCGADLPEHWHADHIVPWSKSGRTNVHEMQPLCPNCNLKKGAGDG
jgi:5-methylcytosine-specific restriction endonuclease McrA